MLRNFTKLSCEMVRKSALHLSVYSILAKDGIRSCKTQYWKLVPYQRLNCQRLYIEKNQMTTFSIYFRPLFNDLLCANYLLKCVKEHAFGAVLEYCRNSLVAYHWIILHRSIQCKMLHLLSHGISASHENRLPNTDYESLGSVTQ